MSKCSTCRKALLYAVEFGLILLFFQQLHSFVIVFPSYLDSFLAIVFFPPFPIYEHFSPSSCFLFAPSFVFLSSLCFLIFILISYPDFL